MSSNFNSRYGYVNRVVRAKTSDYALFYAELEKVVEYSQEWAKYSGLYALFYATIRSFPEILKFFATQDFTIIRDSGLAFDEDDVVYFRSLASKNPDAVSLARTFLGRFYMSQDAGFFSENDQMRSKQFRTSFFRAHTSFPERNWYGYAPPDTYNLSESVYFFELAIRGGASYFKSYLSLLSAIKWWEVTSTYISSFIIACMKLEFLNILPCNTVEYIASKRSKTFSDIVEELLDMLDAFRAGTSKEIYIGWVPIRVVIRQSKTRRLLQTYNIQNYCLGRSDSDDVQKLSRWVDTSITNISQGSLRLMQQVEEVLGRIFRPSTPPNTENL